MSDIRGGVMGNIEHLSGWISFMSKLAGKKVVSLISGL